MAVWINQASTAGTGIIATNYQDDYTVRGNHYLVNKVVEMTSEQTFDFLIDLSDLTEANQFIVLPFSLISTKEEVRVRVYENTGYTGGIASEALRVNRAVEREHIFKLTVGATGTDKGTLIREHIIAASSQGSNINPTLGGASSITILNPKYNYLVEVENMAAATTTIEYNADIFET